MDDRVRQAQSNQWTCWTHRPSCRCLARCGSDVPQTRIHSVSAFIGALRPLCAYPIGVRKMGTAYDLNAPKRAVNLSLNQDLVTQVRGITDNVSEVVESLLVDFLIQEKGRRAAEAKALREAHPDLEYFCRKARLRCRRTFDTLNRSIRRSSQPAKIATASLTYVSHLAHV
jgi:antitoxin CcdA